MDQPFLKNMSLDVSLNSRNPFLVDNNLALLRVTPSIRIRGTASNPLVSGRAQINEGTVTYWETEFDVKKGIIDFVNPYRIEPTLDIRAESQVRQWQIVLLVTGTPENLDFSLSSTPPEEDSDIISLLAVGKTTRELASGSGGTARSPEELLANLLAGEVSRQIKAETGLDIVEVHYRQNGTEDDTEEAVKVTLGKELSRRLTVKYGVERKSGIVVQQSTAIYKLLENLSVNAFQDTAGDFGGEMRYRLEFR
jgi:autotransporter translocation and assembly factor TamB